MTFQDHFGEQGIVYFRDIFLIDPDFDPRQLTRRAQKGYIHKLIDGFWVFHHALQKQGVSAAIANRLYEPSYLSLERGLMYYGLIPESVFQLTSISTRKTQQFDTVAGHFSYQSVKPSLFFGYDLVQIGPYHIRIAQREKVLLDYFYLHPQHRDSDAFDEMRFNITELHQQLDRERLLAYARYYPKTTQKVIAALLTYIDHHA